MRFRHRNDERGPSRQGVRLGPYFGIGENTITLGQSGAAGPSYEAEASALFARFTTPPDDARKGLINDCIRSLKTAGVWSKLDALYIFAAADAQAARRNWVQDLYNATAVSSPTFTADRGYAGNGTTSYLSTGFNPVTASSPQFVRDSATFGIGNRTTRAVNGTATGVNVSSVGIQIFPRFSDGNAYGRINETDATAAGTVMSDSAGRLLVTRTGASATKLYKNGAGIATGSGASVIPPNGTIDLLRSGVLYTTDQFHYGVIGSGFTDADAAAFDAALATYFTAVGA